MIETRPLASLGATRNEWICARHHLSFAGYQDLSRLDWGALRILNHNLLEPYANQRPQPIDGVDILSFVRRGTIAHSGSLGGAPRTLAGEVQLISPGPGIAHADVNPSSRPTEYFELRIRTETVPERAKRVTIKYPSRRRLGELVLLASGFPQDQAPLLLASSTRVFGARIPRHGGVAYALERERRAYLISMKGQVRVNGVHAEPFDGIAVRDEPTIRIESPTSAEIVLVDVRG